MEACRVCGGQMAFLEKRCDVNGNVNDLYLCTRCYVVDNRSIAPEDADEEAHRQQEASVAYYTFNEADVAHIRQELDATKGILAHFQSYIGADVAQKTFLEVGSGRGLLLLAADALGFGTVIGVDLNTATFEETLRHFPTNGAIRMVAELSAVDAQVDTVFLWHTLEHIYDPRSFLRTLTPRLRAHALFVAQVPQYHAPYIFATHYHFYNEPSLTALLTQHGFRVRRFEYDGERQYISVIAEYSGE